MSEKAQRPDVGVRSRANAILSFDPTSERFETFPSDKRDAAVRQFNERAGEVGCWARAGDHRGESRFKKSVPARYPRRRRTLVLVNDT